MNKTVLAVVISALCGNVYAADMLSSQLKNESVFQTNVVMVSAQKIEKEPYEVNGSVTVITSEELEREGATELYDSLKNIPGVSVSGGAGRPQNITIRGMRGNRIKIIEDGVETSDGYGADDLNDKVGRNSFDLSAAKQLEVIKGAGSSLYGSGSLGGLIVITTKDASDYLSSHKNTAVEVDSNYVGESNKIKGTVNIAQRIGSSEHLIRYSQWMGNESNNYTGEVYDRDIDGFDISLISNFYISDHQEIKTKFSYYEDTMNRNDHDNYKPGDFNENTVTSSNKYQVTYLYNGADFALFDDAKVLTYYQLTKNNNNKKQYETKLVQNVNYKHLSLDNSLFDEEKVGLKTEFQRHLDNQNIVWGVDTVFKEHSRKLVKTSISDGSTSISETNPFADANTFNIGMYVHDDIMWNAWDIGVGIRYDFHQLTPKDKNQLASNGYNLALSNATSSEISPSFSIGYNFSDELKAYFSYNHGFNSPNYAKVYGYVPHDGIPPFEIVPNYDLKAETSDNFEIGVKSRMGIYSVNAAVFYSDFDNFIRTKQTGMNSDNGRITIQYVNLDKVTSYGFEMTASAEISETVTASGSVGVVTTEDDNGAYVETSTPWEGNLTLDYSQDFDAFVRWNFVAEMNKVPTCSDGECVTTAGWGTVDLGLSYEPITDLFISSNLNNLFNREYIRYQDVGGMSDAISKYNAEAGRNFNVLVKYNF
ncbi:TonB-dependent hemoglobin/transferrin/lactoferrin family receptor [Photobacterium kishitanii]|uniref:TonB-dependent hemoglobin/transferrin/lactoferrin family receptor n=1 Tax=Photobacterium kishitanii TaxID=318456 RepID=UPI00071AF0FB|nr:TonB-dependent hemoglobin/transferrin/lactoferrin family receptor [Photobacterium kishitanii]OBU27342.1 ligand-gated channel [Photobacterium kishitanii]PSV09335.1 TonB-dependent hemoglobin/transferrin/lactoferrin family receptor [Photobacterium kishitanii]PSW65639.1 TonB-dependent hemoglobin/transferrin/lactoferrin family receptor [Photobacterium kishitanii]